MWKISITILSICLSGIVLNAQYPNILIGTNNTPKEPSIMINPKNPNQVVAGTNINNYYYSGDGGLTWQERPVEFHIWCLG